MSVRTDRGRSAGRLAHGLAIAAMIHVGARIHAARSAGDERQLTTELTLARLAGGSRVRGRHAHLTAGTAIGCITRRVHARGSAGGFAAAGGRTQSVFANLGLGTDFSASAAVFWVRAVVDAVAGAVCIAGVATEPALPAAAKRDAVGRGRAGLATRTTIFDVRVELLATAVAGAVARLAGQFTHGISADGAGVRRATATFTAVPAVTWIGCQIHARTAAVARARWTRGGALAAGTHLVL